ncbi:acyl-CoA dehydrogenase family protein, partial [Nocardioides psychrotolerans]|uniref:acyl-CoA dehydrogenase family protein n=1 Tax=Nocardioides psychrotolerans TaxID=1005945 RepID=UPI003137713F
AVRDGDDWVVNGSKTFITNGYSADLVVTAVRTSPEKKAKGITLFALPTAAEGFSRGRKLDKVGQDESDTAELFFEGLRVTDDDIVGELDNGFIHMMQNLPQERLGCAISNLAHVKQILGETIAYTIDRKAFGASIGSFQHNKFLIAELVTQIEVTQAYVDQCVIAHTKKELTPVDAAKAKWWTSQVQNDVLDHCVQLHGGYGFMNEYRVARAWRDARVSKIWAGSNEIMKELIGRDLGL